MTAPASTPTGPSARRRTPRWIWLALVALLAWSCGLRVWMAGTGLHSGHYWDERYSVKNLRAVLTAGANEPVSYYYPSLSYLPQAGLFAAVEKASEALLDRPFPLFDGGRLLPAGYLLARLVQVAYGVASLLLLFLLGRRLISAEAGLAAAFLLAVTPQHVRLSTMWKPDVTLLLAILLALWWSLDALERPWLRRYLLAGAGIGLALAAKLNGGPIAAPLAIGAIAAGWRDRRHWAGLVLAAVASAAVFVALNPQVGGYLAALDRNRELYSGRAAGPDPTFLGRLAGVVREEIGFVLSENFHGPWIGGAALLGAILVVLDTVRRRDAESGRRALAILAFPLAYTLLYALSTPYAKENNFLQILPFSSLAAAALLTAAGGRLAERLPPAARAPVLAWAAGTLALVLAAPTQVWVYRSLVPTTWDAAIDAVAARLRDEEGRIGFLEGPWELLAGRPRDVKALLEPVEDLDRLPPALLERADAVILSAQRAGDGAGSSRRVGSEGAGGAVLRFEPRWFSLRGPRLLAVVHPREATGSWDAEAGWREDGSIAIELPAAAAGGLVSIELTGRRRRTETAAPVLLAGGRALWLQARPAGRQLGWLSERVPAGDGVVEARLPEAWRGDPELAVRIYAWRP